MVDLLKDVLTVLREAREELAAYELAATGEGYNNTKLNEVIEQLTETVSLQEELIDKDLDQTWEALVALPNRVATQVRHHVREMYPEVAKNAPSTFLRSVGNHVFNLINSVVTAHRLHLESFGKTVEGSAFELRWKPGRYTVSEPNIGTMTVVPLDRIRPFFAYEPTNDKSG